MDGSVSKPFSFPERDLQCPGTASSAKTNNLSYEVYEFEKIFDGLNTNNFSKIKIPKDKFFVLGDNRDNSQDSRFIGLIPRENLIGRAEIVVVSFDTDIGSLFRFWTWFSALRKDRLFVSLLPNQIE